ncbi:galactose-1-phosphate uridylyltransferase [Tepiditoga spiralis]|uniref:Galactose-1-phosphate uridylyltransferase n=1 Tax=Tepiditoga spiralis TaxID=2108365 RepID=A0A7G1G5T0_9BACT|nr:galactose-1-phosphate uridylyltransferase [Tepiditoga spiralis]BBE30656.1 galactose-1-phosphate uridylyltransferase [Tepiditoga spiralis]
MSELRKDPITRRWVIISTERAGRPNNYIKSEEVIENFCPFDYGNENTTPSEILSFRRPNTRPNTSGWWVRVVPNKFPALYKDAELKKSGHGMYDKITGFGYHEVIIETPEHNTSFSKMSDKQINEVIWAYLKRFVEIKKDKKVKYIQIFKNHGKEAGASLVHPHSQIIATPIVPYNILEELNGAENYYKFKDRCIYCDIIEQEIMEKDRVIQKTENFIAFEPYAARFPYETWILPLKHDSNFESIERDPNIIFELSSILHTVFKKFDKTLGNPPFNMVVHTAPFIEGIEKIFHWHIEIIPRLTNLAGFEWGTGFYINSVLPEKAAEDLRREEIL